MFSNLAILSILQVTSLFSFIFPGSVKVVSQKNLGQHVETVLGDLDLRMKALLATTPQVAMLTCVTNSWVAPYSQPGAFCPILLHAGQVITRLVIERSDDVDPKPTLSLVPQPSLQEFWLPLHAFHLGEAAKNGCRVLIG